MGDLQSNVVARTGVFKRAGGWQRKLARAEGQLDLSRRILAHATAWLGPENMQKIYLQVEKEIANGIDRNDGARGDRRNRNAR